jgi:hypothetical protein
MIIVAKENDYVNAVYGSTAMKSQGVVGGGVSGQGVVGMTRGKEKGTRAR